MPTNTFFNLQRDKREKIIDASKREFSKYSFYEASINRIIKEADISRGSFYQYFENKEDLFIYILDEFKYTMLQSLAKDVEKNKYDIFEFLLLVYDFITVDSMNGKDKEFVITTISNMDVKLMKHLLGFLTFDNCHKYKSYFSKLVDIENLKISNLDEFIRLNNVLMNIMMNQIVLFFNNIYNEAECREDLISKLNLLKYGVLKE